MPTDCLPPGLILPVEFYLPRAVDFCIPVVFWYGLGGDFSAYGVGWNLRFIKDKSFAVCAEVESSVVGKNPGA